MDLDRMAQGASRYFSGSYDEARRKFRDAAPEAIAYPSLAKGPSGEALFTDVAYIGPADAKNLLVLISATHGVEGYCGSASQSLFLGSALANTLPVSTAVLLIHALNCYGFAWDRRVTAEGIDLNRNFIDFSASVPANPGYIEIAEHVVPEDFSVEGLQKADAAIAAYKDKHGVANYRQAYSGGQHTHPNGAFFGGFGPSEARLTLEKIAVDFDIASRDSVIIIDYHTGLGPYGYGELQCEEPSGLAGYERAERIFGPSVTSPELGTSTSVRIAGTQDAFWQRLLGDRHVYLALEYGTYPATGSLRKDHWLFQHKPGEVDTPLGRSIRAETKQFFYPERADWQEMVLWRSHQVNRQAIECFSEND